MLAKPSLAGYTGRGEVQAVPARIGTVPQSVRRKRKGKRQRNWRVKWKGKGKGKGGRGQAEQGEGASKGVAASKKKGKREGILKKKGKKGDREI